jgi:flagellar biosynthetic protein FliQ
MGPGDALDLVHNAIWVVIVGSGPAVVAAMVVGVIVALLQALTQIQEMTLTFVPKIVVVFFVFSIGGAYIGGQIGIFAQEVYARVASGY